MENKDFLEITLETDSLDNEDCKKKCYINLKNIIYIDFDYGLKTVFIQFHWWNMELEEVKIPEEDLKIFLE